ncbi:MAG: 23S rRNA (guanosine(2251)-2'-O)-methyltransferase RlmB [Rhizobiales bacterium]|nr:23S rRNA (guanosine(2251)-2'-O)-methyltransferase RlmB [Hyphomicrobiales bacterium]MBI3674016.1 23S rRNA (guanosine(2251)-2'-O)-methyltransferase RlmB [Hyphomicrobiales bacterium]
MTESNDLIYGSHPVEEALGNPRRRFLSLTASKNAADRLAEVIAAAGLTPAIVHPRELDRKLGPDAVHQGLLLEAKPLAQPRLDEIVRQGVIVVLDQVTDPHNVGAILRSCAAFAVTALVTTARHSPEASGVLFKSASGAFEHVPYVRVTNLSRALDEMKSYGFHIVGLDSEAASSISGLTAKPPLAVVLGAEGKGLRQLTRSHCDELVRLDLTGPIRSLNVSNAAAIALYALRR